LEKGLVSKSGWVLFNDTKNVLFDDDGWVAPRPEYELQDWYFFGYGHHYKAALSDYARFGGKTPLIPYFILGGWWSRYWAYSENDLRNLVAEFEENDVPLDVFVIDMDWHTPQGWTGYTWNRDLFPDPPLFLNWLHAKGFKITLNLHPADGVHPHEEVYPAFARAMHIDPKSKRPVPFRIADKDYVKHYFEMIHHPMEDDGVDFWWMDWQQGEISEVKGLDPLPWINHLHFNDIKRRGFRPMLYSRWGGLGNHRYYIGFSGDTYVTWESLQFQPYFTATAANVMYGWWSHDIGGHMGGPTEPELYARWVQFGALSPVLRLHSTKDARAERRPWAYPDEIYQAAKQAFQFRYKLIPYLYTMARIASDTNITLCRPMYYQYPELEDAYAARHQYFFGELFIAAPFVFPRNSENKLAAIDIWIPPGTWYAYDTLETFHGSRWVKLVGAIDRMPLVVQSGAVIPMAPYISNKTETLLKSGTTATLPKDHLELVVFPGKGQFELYEDDGITEAYRNNQYRWARFTTTQPDTKTWLLSIYPVEGMCQSLPAKRRYTIHLRRSSKPASVTINERRTQDWHYSAQDNTTIIELPYIDTSQMTVIRVQADENIIILGKEIYKHLVKSDVETLLAENCPDGPLEVEAVLALDSPGKMEAIARLGAPFVSVVEFTTPDKVFQNLGTLIIASPEDGSTYSVEITLSLLLSGCEESRIIEYEKTKTSHIIPLPYRCECAETTRWEAEVKFTWRGHSWISIYRSKVLFPAVNLWQCLSYDPVNDRKLKDSLFNDTGIQRHKHLKWKESSPSIDADITFTRSHTVQLNELFKDEYGKSKKLSVLLTSVVDSPDDRMVALEYTSNTKARIELNGEYLPEKERVDDTALGRFITGTHFTVTAHLKAGANALIVDCPAPEQENVKWFFGCAFTSPEGELLTDLSYD
jgi:hypothetical protein